jgi:hypothetical protein
MKKVNKYIRVVNLLTIICIILLLSQHSFAQDDGARAYWNARAGTNVISFQYLPLNIGASGSQAFAPGQYIYPNSDIAANIFVGTWARHMTLFNRPSALAVNIIGGSVDANFNTRTSTDSLPPGMSPGTALSQSSSGFSDPNMQLVVNLFGTPPLRSGVDLLNYEPTWSLDIAMMLAFPIGEYENDKLVNIGLNRWYGRIALPFKWHFGVFSPGYMSSFELIPSVWLFAENSDFLEQKLENEPLWSLEAHLTHDFTSNFFGSLDMLYQSGFQSKINGDAMGENLEIGNLGFALNYQISDNITIRTGYSSNVFGDKNLETSVVKLQFVYAWHTASENMKKLMEGH